MFDVSAVNLVVGSDEPSFDISDVYIGVFCFTRYVYSYSCGRLEVRYDVVEFSNPISRLYVRGETILEAGSGA